MIIIDVDIPDAAKLSNEVDYHRLLWQELNKNFGNDTTVFVMAVGEILSSADYSITDGHAELAAKNTFQLVDHTIACAINCSKGSPISTMWTRLLQGRGPRAGPEEQPAFAEAKRALYVDYDKKLPTELYKEYRVKEHALMQKELQIEDELREKYGDQWKVYFDKRLKASKEYLDFQYASEEVKPHLDAIKIWIHGPLVHDLDSLKQGT